MPRKRSGRPYQPKVIFNVTEEALFRSQRVFPTKNIRGALLAKVFDDILDLVEEYGQEFAIALTLSGEDSTTVLPRIRRGLEITRKFVEGGTSDGPK